MDAMGRVNISRQRSWILLLAHEVVETLANLELLSACFLVRRMTTRQNSHYRLLDDRV
ncbi:hypothetical protein EC9_30930 [Rosistilla ulvae]|uniref:Uncharacterized protein n=1 Tax=Rosistilla ulvae TaxID=1930277 RepID=A0A517M201_9BACT|nr:hypothetical protein EC9_30930 [Rosistilla ulvae]